MPTEWVDFKTVKDAVSMQMVLDHYGITNLRKSGDELRGPCPIHKGPSRQTKNFSVNTIKNAFKCFAKDCGAHGNVLDFAAAMDGSSIRDAAIKLRDLFKAGESARELITEVESPDEAAEVQRGIYQDKDGALYEVVANAIAEDLAQLVVYRELFGDFRYWLAAPENFHSTGGTANPSFTLIRTL